MAVSRQYHIAVAENLKMSIFALSFTVYKLLHAPLSSMKAGFFVYFFPYCIPSAWKRNQHQSQCSINMC